MCFQIDESRQDRNLSEGIEIFLQEAAYTIFKIISASIDFQGGDHEDPI